MNLNLNIWVSASLRMQVTKLVPIIIIIIIITRILSRWCESHCTCLFSHATGVSASRRLASLNDSFRMPTWAVHQALAFLRESKHYFEPCRFTGTPVCFRTPPLLFYLCLGCVQAVLYGYFLPFFPCSGRRLPIVQLALISHRDEENFSPAQVNYKMSIFSVHVNWVKTT
jgi:hypothetical protein